MILCSIWYNNVLWQVTNLDRPWAKADRSAETPFCWPGVVFWPWVWGGGDIWPVISHVNWKRKYLRAMPATGPRMKFLNVPPLSTGTRVSGGHIDHICRDHHLGSPRCTHSMWLENRLGTQSNWCLQASSTSLGPSPRHITGLSWERERRLRKKGRNLPGRLHLTSHTAGQGQHLWEILQR